ncbi:TetR family transcriptional regulator [Listeria grayi]|uniref:TetR family transcriptional regulator n=1 Tax=Listeria grayi TaxID=1641 RepID=UPI0016283974|nr:TetR family transcriptional regulator [Listeria grayi]MBC1922397.1 TetR family transcriptional regulator [Listeria grayi]
MDKEKKQPQLNTRDRLEQAALELFEQKGYSLTTAEEIAKRANVTERTFFRYFSEKKEVLFSESATFLHSILAELDQQPKTVSDFEKVYQAFYRATKVFFKDLHAHSKYRAKVISSTQELREREQTKFHFIEAKITEKLIEEGSDPFQASIVANLGIKIFEFAFNDWVNTEAELPFDEKMEETKARFMKTIQLL